MHRDRLVAIAALMVLLGALTPEPAQTSGILLVRATPEVSREPAAVRLMVRVDPDEANRTLLVGVDSPDLYRSSLITVSGESARSSYWVDLSSLPAGDYTVTATLHRNDRCPAILPPESPRHGCQTQGRSFRRRRP
jgi:hypothetical protein